MLRWSMYSMNRSENPGAPCRSSIICFFGTMSSEVVDTAVAVPIRIGCPASAPSPRKSPGPSTPTIASFPVCDSTESLTAPFWMYMTLSPGSPWANITAKGSYSAIFLEIPAEARKASVSNFDGAGFGAGFLRARGIGDTELWYLTIATIRRSGENGVSALLLLGGFTTPDNAGQYDADSCE